jgi:DNA polymerase III delta subunit
MIYIFHGDNQFTSRTALNSLLDQKKDFDIFRIDTKDINLDNINGFINSQSLFSTQKIIVFFNFFSILKANLDKIFKILKTNNSVDVVIWQDKLLTPTQLKNFPKAKVELFPLDKKIFACLNNLYPNNLSKFLTLYRQVVEQEPFELFLFWVKFNLRKQLTGFSRFSPESLKNAYIQTIELDFQSKTGQLDIPKEIALERIFINLLK